MHASACMNARVFTGAEAGKSEQMWRPFQNKACKNQWKNSCASDLNRSRNTVFCGNFWMFCLGHVSPYFTPACPGSFKKNSLTADRRKELLSQHLSSLPHADACQPEHRLFHMSPKPHAQVLGSNRPIIQLHRAAKAPQQEMFIWLCCRKMQPSSVSKQR